MACIYISLGRHCATAHHINQIIGYKESNIFDWVRTDFEVICDILDTSDINTLFCRENLFIDMNMYKHEGEIAITLKNFNKKNLTFLFHHEIKHMEYTEEELEEKVNQFIEKYKRRYFRLIDYICSEKRIIFIYHDTINHVNESLIDHFDKSIRRINPDIKYHLILLHQNNDELLQEEKSVIKINYKTLIDPNIIPIWTYNQIDWNNIFNMIQINIK
jgi:hypothetical protein